MSDSKSMRLLIEHTKASEIMRRELFLFNPVAPEESGLPYYIYVDCSAAYKKFNHKLWLYVEVGNEKFAVTIDRKPVFIGLCHSNADFKPLIRFIQRHLELLKNYANEKVDNRIFYEIIGQLQESVLNESVLLTEMSKLQPTETGLPCSIWVDEDKTYLPHAPKIGKL